jgi:uncharacterized membrane protein
MPFCSGCGAEVGSDAAFCRKCGRSLSSSPAPIAAGAAPTTGLRENVAGFLCYILFWVSGLLFFLIDKRPSVRFHAMQSMITFGGLFAINWLFSWGGWFSGFLGFAVMSMFHSLLGVVVVVCWILCMVKAYQGQRYKLPVVGDMAENYSK